MTIKWRKTNIPPADNGYQSPLLVFKLEGGAEVEGIYIPNRDPAIPGEFVVRTQKKKGLDNIWYGPTVVPAGWRYKKPFYGFHQIVSD